MIQQTEKSQVTLGQIIQYLRKTRNGYSARDVSINCGFSPSYLSKVEADQLVPSIVAFSKLIKPLKMTKPEIMMILNNLRDQ